MLQLGGGKVASIRQGERSQQKEPPLGNSRPLLAGVHTTHSKKSVSLALVGKVQHDRRAEIKSQPASQEGKRVL